MCDILLVYIKPSWLLCHQLVVSSRFNLWIRELHSTHLSAILASFYLRQSDQSIFSKILSGKTLTFHIDELMSQSDFTGVEPGTSGLIYNQSCRKLQPWWSQITVNGFFVLFQVHSFQSQGLSDQISFKKNLRND